MGVGQIQPLALDWKLIFGIFSAVISFRIIAQNLKINWNRLCNDFSWMGNLINLSQNEVICFLKHALRWWQTHQHSNVWMLQYLKALFLLKQSDRANLKKKSNLSLCWIQKRITQNLWCNWYTLTDCWNNFKKKNPQTQMRVLS